MIRGLYTAATGMLAEQFVQDAIASNLANASTVGYRQDVPTFKSLHDLAVGRYGGPSNERGAPIGRMGLGSAFDRTVVDHTSGSFTPTKRMLDAALVGEGFFAVQTPQGERLTRAGAFELAPVGRDAYLVDTNGNKVLGLKGPILIPGGAEPVIDPEGRVSAAGKEIDTLKLVTSDHNTLKKAGGSLFVASSPVVAATPIVKQGVLEQSNVNTIQSMVRMITVQRAYDAAQRTITAQDEALGKAVNEVGRT